MQLKSTPLKLCVLMDDISHINPVKDTSFAMMLSAQQLGFELYYATHDALSVRTGTVFCALRPISVRDTADDYYTCGEERTVPIDFLDATIIRLDPPFTQEYMYLCHLLSLGEAQGCRSFNAPHALCNYNEKLFISEFPALCAPTVVAKNTNTIHSFIDEYADVILKPLDGMGGSSIFRVQAHDKNRPVIVETLSNDGTNSIMAQRYIPDINQGDKRILIVDGTPCDFALARIPSASDHRGNLAAGGKGVVQPLSDRDRYIANTVGMVLKQRGIVFAGIDVIGDYLTEINITSPTGCREIESQGNIDIAGTLLHAIAQQCQRS